MRRGKPMKRSPLKRGDSKLHSNKPLRKRSKKTEDKYVHRRQLVKSILESNQECIACIIYTVHDRITYDFPVGNLTRLIRTNKTTDVHELVNRSQGGSILDTNNLLAVCRSCHSRITTEPKEAEMLGLHLESWCNTTESFIEAKRVRNEWQNGNPTKPNWL